jgi:hypothetical protein
MAKDDWRCPFCDAEWFFLARIDKHMQCFRCWKTWLPRTVESPYPTD